MAKYLATHSQQILKAGSSQSAKEKGSKEIDSL